MHYAVYLLWTRERSAVIRPVDIDCISTMRTLFPQKKRAITTSFSSDYEYDSNQRKRDLPEGESRQGLSREPATGLARHTGNWMLRMEPRKLLQRMLLRKRMRIAGSGLQFQAIPEWQSCDLETGPGLRKIGKEGAISRKGDRPFPLWRYRF